MSVISRYQFLFNQYLTTHQPDQRIITFFCKSLYVFLLLKIFFMREVVIDLLLNTFWAGSNIIAYGFLILMVLVLVLSLFLKVNYVSASLIFLLSFIFSRSTHLIANGSDLILNLFLFLSIFFSDSSRVKNSLLRKRLSILRNFFFLLCQVQLALIYLLSGFDKLMSEAWRSGAAVHSIMNMDYFFHPALSVSSDQTVCMLLAWSAIVFELAFAFLIWIRKLRIPLLISGVIFHAGIAIFLSLPDFGILMILLYTIFIPVSAKQTMPTASYGS